MSAAHWAICGLAVLTLLWPGPRNCRAAEKELADGQVSFEMQEVATLDAKDDQIVQFSGIHVYCGTEPAKAVKAYPKPHSKRPLYGTLEVGRNPFRNEPGVEYHFVLDSSGEPKKAESKSLTGAIAAAIMGAANPETEEYDLLYFDANHDLDLTNDPVVKLRKPPARLLAIQDRDQQQSQFFDDVTLTIGYGPGIGTQPFRLMPVLASGGAEARHLWLVPTEFRQGTIRIGQREYTAVLSQSDITGRFDRPTTNLRLKPARGSDDKSQSRGLDYLCVMRTFDGQLYDISATPTGDRLFVKPYRGDFGVLEIAPGGRDTKTFGAGGLLMSDNDRLLQLGDDLDSLLSDQAKEKPREYRLPAGNYRVAYLAVNFGSLSFTVDDLGANPNQPRQEPVYPLKIRADKPCVLDFSAKPAITFINPHGEQTFKPGETVKIEAFLVDPTWNLMVSRVATTAGSREFVASEGGKRVYVPRPIEPTVEISDSSGKKVAEGTMPFG